MGKDMENYVRNCPMCCVMKSDHQKKVGLLQPIPIPNKKWEQISTDLATELLPSYGYKAIVVSVDHLIKMFTSAHVLRKL